METQRYNGATDKHSAVFENGRYTVDLFCSLLLAALFLSSGCTSIPSDKLTAFSQGVTTAKTQANTVFTAVNTLTSAVIIDYAATQPSLNDKNLFAVLDAPSMAKWDQVFSALEKYSQSLILLTSKDITKDYKSATVDLASQINETSTKLQKEGFISSAPQLSAGVATAFSELGNILIKAKASADAKATIRQTDPVVRTVFNNMADVIGATTKDGIRGAVHGNWENLKGQKKNDFLQADAGKRHDIVAAYAEIKDKQTAQDLALASLQRSLRALADAHHALAQDSRFEVDAAVAVVKSEANDTKDVYNRLKTALDTKH
jgi:hypothetical protein